MKNNVIVQTDPLMVKGMLGRSSSLMSSTSMVVLFLDALDRDPLELEGAGSRATSITPSSSSSSLLPDSKSRIRLLCAVSRLKASRNTKRWQR